MLGQIAINSVFALVWMFLHAPYNVYNFLGGWLLGLVIVYFWQRQAPGGFYLRKVWDVIFLILVFLWEVFKSCFAVMRLVFTPGNKMRSGLITYETELTAPWQLVMLSSMITISPGSFVIEISPDNKVFLIHVFDFADEESFRQDIRVYFEDNIKRVADEL